MRRAILLFLKYPEAGRVKTRLAATMGDAEAVEIYRMLVAEVCRSLPEDRESIIVLFDPPERKPEVECWVAALNPDRSFTFRPQHPGDLGNRMAHALADIFDEGFDQVMVIGSDCVELTTEIFAETWRKLEQNDLVLGPSSDGGYYLLALRAPAPVLFEDIAWSTDAVLAQTLSRAESIGLCFSLLPELHDVDTEDDWRRVEARLKP